MPHINNGILLATSSISVVSSVKIPANICGKTITTIVVINEKLPHVNIILLYVCLTRLKFCAP